MSSGGASGQSGVGGTSGSSPSTGGSLGTGGRLGSGGMLGSGGFSGSGGPSNCQASGPCQPANPCQTGVYSCATGTLQCVPTGNQPATVQCGSPQSCTGSTKYLKQLCDGNGACAAQVTQACPANETCSGTDCVCNSPNEICDGACVNTQSDPNNCGGCGLNSCATNSMGCSAGQCTCTVNTANGMGCTRPGQVKGTCWSGACVLPAHFSGCNSAADCVPGGCTGPGGYCLGAIDVAGQVSCTDDSGLYAVCPAQQGCYAYPPSSRTPGTFGCGDGTGITRGNCDGPSDCPANSDCCWQPGGGTLYPVWLCQARTDPGVIGSGCPTLGPGTQLNSLCDPLNPTSTCPANKSCTPEVSGAQVYFTCE